VYIYIYIYIYNELYIFYELYIYILQYLSFRIFRCEVITYTSALSAMENPGIFGGFQPWENAGENPPMRFLHVGKSGFMLFEPPQFPGNRQLDITKEQHGLESCFGHTERDAS
jgi:hypothetical protein